jgi:hypothetical protein
VECTNDASTWENERKRWKDEVEEDLNIMGIKNGHAAGRYHWKWRKIVLQATMDCSA